MSLFNEIQVGRFNRFVQKLLSMKGPPTMPTVSTDLVFVHSIDSGQENRYLQGWDLFAFFKAAITASAANNSTMELRNPTGSNVMVVVTRAMFNNTTVTDLALLATQRGATADQAVIDNSGAGLVQSFDARGRTVGTAIVSDNNGAAFTNLGGTGNSAIRLAVPANNNAEFIRGPWDEIPISPGSALYVQSNVAATAVNIAIWWRERALEDSERS